MGSSPCQEPQLDTQLVLRVPWFGTSGLVIRGNCQLLQYRPRCSFFLPASIGVTRLSRLRAVVCRLVLWWEPNRNRNRKRNFLPKIITVWKRDSGRVIFLRLCWRHLVDIKGVRRLCFHKVSRPISRRSMLAIFQHVINCPWSTGSGKSYVAIGLCRRPIYFLSC